MIHVSLDQDLESASEWAAANQFPWPTVLPDDVEPSGLNQFKNGNFVPDYSLVRADGKKIGSGPGVFDKISKL